jgi:hypothetical protein
MLADVAIERSADRHKEPVRKKRHDPARKAAGHPF